MGEYPRIDHRTFSMTISSVPQRISVLEVKSRVDLIIKNAYEEQVLVYRVSCELKVPWNMAIQVRKDD